ncbi:MAG TPA: PepSY-associated TM helix domain-containing protein [Bacteroidales bacterium]|nr:PepSY-associated TM helix domain-containing protein [Bacteroidales bacterium]
MKISKINRVTHRDIGYFIAGLTIIYALSGISLNHKNDWNPNYISDIRPFHTKVTASRESFNEETALNILSELDLKDSYKAFHFPTGNRVTIFIEGGFVQMNTLTGEGVVEKITRRPLFFEINILHYNPGVWWKYFSDLFCICLILVTITGLFLIKGRNGITGRGAILTIAGILLPILFLFIYL